MKSNGAMLSRLRLWTKSQLLPKATSWTLIALALLSAGCAPSLKSLAPGVQPAQVPPLQQSARQPKRSESFSASVSRDIESWEKRLTELDELDKPAK